MKASVHLSPDAQTALAERVGVPGMSTRSAVLNRALLRYHEVCRRHLPDLSDAEWNLCFDAMNGCWLDSPMHAQAEIEDSMGLNESHRKWQVDREALSQKLQRLDYAGWCALVDASERFWARYREDLMGDPRAWPAQRPPGAGSP